MNKIIIIIQILTLLLSIFYGITMFSGINFSNLLGMVITLTIWGIIETSLIDTSRQD